MWTYNSRNWVLKAHPSRVICEIKKNAKNQAIWLFLTFMELRTKLTPKKKYSISRLVGMTLFRSKSIGFCLTIAIRFQQRLLCWMPSDSWIKISSLLICHIHVIFQHTRKSYHMEYGRGLEGIELDCLLQLRFIRFIEYWLLSSRL